MTKLLPTGSCGIHSILETFKTGENKTDQVDKKLLKALNYILHDTPARCADYTDVTRTQQFPLPFCGIRWIEDDKGDNQSY